MAFLQVLQTREDFVEILRQVEHLLRHVHNLSLWALAHLHHLTDQRRLDEVLLFQLLADLQRHVQAPYSNEARLAPAQLVVVRGHLRQVESHFAHQKFEALLGVAVRWQRFLLFLLEARVALVANVKKLLQVDAEVVEH